LRLFTKISRIRLGLAATALTILALGATAMADATYTYTGANFTYNGSIYPIHNITGSFTVRRWRQIPLSISLPPDRARTS
jgi:hypothetical protein